MRYFITLLLLILAATAVYILYEKAPVTGKSRPERLIPLVDTIIVEPDDEEIFIKAYGTVIPAKEVSLQSEVDGRVIEVSSNLIPGGLIKRGEPILRIDPSDYIMAVKERKADMEEALYELEIEQGRQVIAKREWELLGEEVRSYSSNQRLVLREPHSKRLQARLEAAENRLRQAELDLNRTELRAPFNSLVIDEFVDVGKIVSRQSVLAVLAGTDHYRVKASISADKISRISFPDSNSGSSSETRIVFDHEGDRAIIYKGRVLSLLGDLDPKGRMARVLIEIEDPLNLDIDNSGHRILLNSYVMVEISAGTLHGVYSIPREVVREGAVLWTVDENSTLKIKKIDILWRKKEEVLVRGDLTPGLKVISGKLRSPLPGMKVRIASQAGSG